MQWKSAKTFQRDARSWLVAMAETRTATSHVLSQCVPHHYFSLVCICHCYPAVLACVYACVNCSWAKPDLACFSNIRDLPLRTTWTFTWTHRIFPPKQERKNSTSLKQTLNSSISKKSVSQVAGSSFAKWQECLSVFIYRYTCIYIHIIYMCANHVQQVIV